MSFRHLKSLWTKSTDGGLFRRSVITNNDVSKLMDCEGCSTQEEAQVAKSAPLLLYKVRSCVGITYTYVSSSLLTGSGKGSLRVFGPGAALENPALGRRDTSRNRLGPEG